MIPRLPKYDTVYLSLALGTMSTLYLYVKFAMPHIMRWLEIGLS